MRYRLTKAVLEDTFSQFRQCGAGERECQAIWVGPWAHPDLINQVVHPKHTASAVGFQVDDAWLTGFLIQLGQRDAGIRVQVHTHPGPAYHSGIDDDFPLLREVGFLSLVIPNFGLGPVGFDRAFLARVDADGVFREVPIADHLEII